MLTFLYQKSFAQKERCNRYGGKGSAGGSGQHQGWAGQRDGADGICEESGRSRDDAKAKGKSVDEAQKLKLKE